MIFNECTNSQSQGNVGMGQAIAYYTQKGQTVSIPLNDCQEYDLVVEYPDGLKKVQVKTTKSKAPSGRYVVGLRTMSGYKDPIRLVLMIFSSLLLNLGRFMNIPQNNLRDIRIV